MSLISHSDSAVSEPASRSVDSSTEVEPLENWMCSCSPRASAVMRLATERGYHDRCGVGWQLKARGVIVPRWFCRCILEVEALLGTGCHCVRSREPLGANSSALRGARCGPHREMPGGRSFGREVPARILLHVPSMRLDSERFVSLCQVVGERQELWREYGGPPA